jgi:cell division protein FtsQ
MWDNPDALNRISRLILLATLLFALWIVGRAALENAFPFRQINVVGANHADTRAEARKLAGTLAGGFFSMNLHQVHADFEKLPWVQEAQVRRLWPGRLVIELTEHRAAAAWNDRATLNTQGDVFPVMPWTGLPRIYAPEGMHLEAARRYGEFFKLVRPMGLRIEQIVVSARMSWRVRLTPDAPTQARCAQPGTDIGGAFPCGVISVELGRERLNERLARFARFYPQAVAAVGPIQRVDMRYPNGFSGEPRHPAAGNVETRQAKPA